MTTPRLTTLTKNRQLVLAAGTGVMALVTAIFIVGAPPLPAILGVSAAVAWLIWRAQTKSQTPNNS